MTTEVDWLVGRDPSNLLSCFPGYEPAEARKLRLFAIACCYLVWEEMPRFARKWVLLAERVAEEHLPEKEFLSERRRAFDVALRASKRSVSLACDALASFPAVAARSASATLRGTPERTRLHALLLDSFGNPFRPVVFCPEWRTDAAVALARQMYEARDFSAMPILADALQEAGCDNEVVLDHCRGPGPHLRGCWVCDLVLALGGSRESVISNQSAVISERQGASDQ
jgi:hypothetical protein